MYADFTIVFIINARYSDCFSVILKEDTTFIILSAKLPILLIVLLPNMSLIDFTNSFNIKRPISKAFNIIVLPAFNNLKKVTKGIYNFPPVEVISAV